MVSSYTVKGMKLYTGKAIAGALGISESEVESLQNAKVISYRQGNLYALEETAAKIIAHYKEPEQKAETVDYTVERAKLMRAKRLSEEHELAVREGSLHEAADIELVISTMLLNFRARIMAIPAKLAPAIAGMDKSEDVHDKLKSEMDNALQELSSYDVLFHKEDEDAETDGETG